MQFGGHLKDFLVDDRPIFPLSSVFLTVCRAFRGPQKFSKEAYGSFRAPIFVATIQDAPKQEGAQGTDTLICIFFGPNRLSPQIF